MSHPAPPRSPAADAPQKVAIIGTGPAGLAAAFALTDPDVAGRFEVHVHQLGWRAGGKAGTGRNADKGQRVEQNGSHYLFGCYHNAFSLVRRAYAELGPDAGFGRYTDNFTPCNVLAGAAREPPDGDGRHSFIFFPSNLALPGTGSLHPRPFDYLLMAFQILLTALLTPFVGDDDPTWAGRTVSALFPLCPFRERTVGRRLWGRTLRALLWLPAALVNRVLFPPAWWLASLIGRGVLGQLRRRPSARERWIAMAEAAVVAGRSRARRGWRAAQSWVARSGIGWGWDGRLAHLAALSELAATVTVGLVRDRLWQTGSLAAIDHLDFREWLEGHGAERTASRSVFVKCWYDAVIAYEGGDPERPRMSAGVALNAIFKAFLGYKGSFAYQMGHEMGDGWVAPLVQALVARGVKFHFFHRVWDLVPGHDSDGRPIIEALVVERQVGDRPGHQLFTRLPSGRLVWPERPLFDGQPAMELVHQGLDGFYGRDSGDRLTLRRGRDFDCVISTIPSDALPWQAPSCYREQPRWQRMVEGIDAAESISLRIWFSWSLPSVGWPHPPPILSAFAWPFSTWEDNSQSLGQEAFSGDERPRAVATVFGSLRAPRKAPPPGPEGARLLRRQHLQAVRHARRFWQRQASALWPALAEGPALGWQPLFRTGGAASTPDDRAGRARLRWQLLRANVGPLERYVLALPGTLRHRLRPHETGYHNLLFAGDWARNGIEVGCAEGAVISGLQAARWLTGNSAEIPGEDDFDRGLVPGRRA